MANHNPLEEIDAFSSPVYAEQALMQVVMACVSAYLREPSDDEHTARSCVAARLRELADQLENSDG